MADTVLKINNELNNKESRKILLSADKCDAGFPKPSVSNTKIPQSGYLGFFEGSIFFNKTSPIK